MLIILMHRMLGPRSVEVTGVGGPSSAAMGGAAGDEMDIKQEGD